MEYMRNGGLEPPSLAAHVPETCASTNSARSAFLYRTMASNSFSSDYPPCDGV